MEKAVISNRIYMNRTPQLHQDLNEELHYVLPPKMPGGPNESECDVTRINKDILTIPSGRIDLIPEGYEIVDNRVLVPASFPAFKFKLRPSQQSVYDSCKDNCIIRANPSWGKTFMGVALSTKLKQKTLVVVHTKFLFDQWVSEIKLRLGIDAGRIGNGIYNIDSPIVISTVQSLRNRILDLTSTFGTVIVDECHHVPASVFKSIVDKFKARYKIGLTATPWRKDGRHIMLYDYFGGRNEEFVPPDENSIKPTIIMLETDIPFSNNSADPWPTRVSELYARHDWMELIVSVSEIYAKNDYLVLTVSDRVEFLTTCAEVIDNSLLVIGATEDRDILKSGKNPVFGSSKIFSEGVNIPPLSCLVLGMCINNRTLLEQLIGRVCRVHEGKKDPIVVDIKLRGKTAKNQAAQRINYYMEKGYKIEYIKV